MITNTTTAPTNHVWSTPGGLATDVTPAEALAAARCRAAKMGRAAIGAVSAAIEAAANAVTAEAAAPQGGYGRSYGTDAAFAVLATYPDAVAVAARAVMLAPRNTWGSQRAYRALVALARAAQRSQR